MCEQMQHEHFSMESEQRPASDNEGGNVNSLTSFLHKLRHMPAQKQQQLVSTSAAMVRGGVPSNGDSETSNKCENSNNATATNGDNNNTSNRDKVFEIVYGAYRESEKSPKPIEKQGKCFVVDAHERRIRIVNKEDQRKQHVRLIHLEDVPENELARFGHTFPEDLIESTDRFVHCNECSKYYDFCCLEHPLYQCQDRDPALSAPNSPSKEGEERAALTLPGFLYLHSSQIPNAGKGVFTKVDIPTGVVFGPYEGILLQDTKKASQDGYAWELRNETGKPSCYIDAKDPRYSNWMRFINSPRHEGEQNLLAFQYRGSIFYRVYRPIDKNTELLVWYGKSFAKELGIINSSSNPPPSTLKRKPYIFYPGKNPFVL